MNILGLFLVEIIGAALFSLAFFGGISLHTYCYIEALKSLAVWVLRFI